MYGTVKNGEKKGKIYLVVNDFPIKNTQFNPETGAFSAYLNLAPGRNAIKLIGCTAAGTDTDYTSIITIDPMTTVKRGAEASVDPMPTIKKNSIDTREYRLSTSDGKSELEKGDIIQLHNLQFSANSAQLNEKDSEQLNDLFNLDRKS